jgi:type IV secretory pathway VirB3-like protein
MKISFNFLFLLVSTLVISFRFILQTLDTHSYIEYIEKINIGLDVEVESSFLYFTKLSYFLGLDYYGVFLFYAIIGFFLKIIAIRRISSFPLISLGIYFSYSFVINELIQMRVGAALTFATLSIWYLAKDKNLLSTLFAILSFWFHNSLLFLFIVVIFFYVSRLAIKNNAKIIVISMIVLQLVTLTLIITKLDLIKFFLDISLFDLNFGKIQHYLIEYEPDFFRFNYLKFLFFIFISTPGIYLLLKDKVNSLFIWHCILLNTTSSIIYGIFFNYTTIGIRLSDIFMFFNIFTIPYYIEKFKYAGYFILGVVILVYAVNLGFNITSYI